ncbi:hypothetical protein WA026_010981 [Henosepilachna vigintioctopunctata]|uniref:H/ACA ribonucleoprotein complex non-core subunit NAF1 n=1 Tax=Henosepilachna vigintioctopunctata TaxID=420089 RepID=A0AAW1UX69_9CUCU
MSEISGHVSTNQDDPCANQSERNFKNWTGNSENLEEKTLRTNEEKCETNDEAMCAEQMDWDLEFNSSNAVFKETANSNNYSGINDDFSESLTDLQGFKSGGDDKNDTDSNSEDSNPDSQDIDTDTEDNQNSEDDTDTHTDSDKNEFTKNNSGVAPNQNIIFRGNVDGSEDSETENDDIAANIAEVSNASNGSKVPRKKKKKEYTWLSEGCLEIPDISSLELNDKDQFLHMGKIHHILKEDGVLVCVVPLPNMPAYDLNTIFFLDEGKKVLGYPWDVMGQVKSPTYVFKLNEHLIQDLSIEKDAKVYCVPNSKYTSLVQVDELMKARGSDASWIADTEVPTEFADFSADEEEQQCKKSSSKLSKRKHSSVEHRKFENAMNTLNLIKTQHYDSKPLHNSDKARIIPSRQMPSRFPTIENFDLKSKLHHMNHAGARISFPPPEWTVRSPSPSPQWRSTPSPQWPPSVHQQWTPGPPRQLSPGPSRQLMPGPSQQPPLITTQQFLPSTSQQFPTSSFQYFSPEISQQVIPFPPQMHPLGQSQRGIRGQYSVNQPQWFSTDYFSRFASQRFITPPPLLYNVPVGIPPPGPPLHSQFPHLFDPSTPPPNYGGGKGG